MTISTTTPFLIYKNNRDDYGTPNASELVVGPGLKIDTPKDQLTQTRQTIISLLAAPEGTIGNFLLSDGTYSGLSNGIEKVTYKASTALQNFLEKDTTGSLSCTLPIGFSVTSPSDNFSIKVALGTNKYTPLFTGDNDKYSLEIKSANSYIFNPVGMTLYVPLNVVGGQKDVTEIIFFIQNLNSTPYVSSYASYSVITSASGGIQ